LGIKTPISGVSMLYKWQPRFPVFLYFYRFTTPKIGVYIPLHVSMIQILMGMYHNNANFISISK
jgi:hypothetical protein